MLFRSSPKCAAFSVLQNLNADSPQWRQTLQEGLEHLTFACRLYKIQIHENRFFLHEHPHSAASWGLRMVREVSAMPGVIRTHGDQCPYGLLGEDESGNPALIQKRTGWLTNSPRIAEAVSKRCTNRINPPHQHHRHGHVFAWKNCRESTREVPATATEKPSSKHFEQSSSIAESSELSMLARPRTSRNPFNFIPNGINMSLIRVRANTCHPSS